MPSELIIVRPDGAEERARVDLAPISMPLGPVGILDNHKPNAGPLLDAIRNDLLRSLGGEAGPVRQKAYPAMQAPPQTLAGLAKECAVVLVGSGD